MSFGFQFDDDELDEEYKDSTGTRKQESAEDDSHESESKASTSTSKATRHTLDELLSALPSRISYSSLTIPLKESNRTLYRRDLFDARFQLINDDQGEDRAESEDRFSAGTQTDLIPGIYEGGFKTWECAIDLVAHLEERISQQEGLSWLKDVRATELGCGTALPSMYLFARMLSTTDEEIDSSFVLCDFNEQVLRLVTLPNLFLTWYFHEAQGHQAEPNGDIEITPEAVEDFQTCLKKQNITLDFYSGSWDTLHEAGAFDQSGSRKSIVLTSETIYSMQSLPTLVNALEMACSGSIESSLQRAALCDATDNGPRKCLCLVAAKVLYFGVGGGVNAFNDELKRRRARSKTVWHSERGVSRLVLQVDFEGAAIDATE